MLFRFFHNAIILLPLTAYSLSATAINKAVPITKPWIRLSGGANHIRIDPKGKYLAYTDINGKRLRVLDIKNKKIYSISKQKVGASFFWAPDGIRLFYRELLKTKEGTIKSSLNSFDARILKSIKIESYPYTTGLLTFDPRDLRMHLLHSKGVHTKRIFFPNERLARWQIAQRKDIGKLVAGQKGIVWLTQGGFSMKWLKDDQSGIESFDLSPDGTTVAWATKSENVFISQEGEKPSLIGKGRDPKWHPYKPILVYSGARRIGNKTIDYDLKVTNQNGIGRFLTYTPEASERWPIWNPTGKKIIYTKSKTTDLYQLSFKVEKKENRGN